MVANVNNFSLCISCCTSYLITWEVLAKTSSNNVLGTLTCYLEDLVQNDLSKACFFIMSWDFFSCVAHIIKLENLHIR